MKWVLSGPGQFRSFFFRRVELAAGSLKAFCGFVVESWIEDSAVGFHIGIMEKKMETIIMGLYRV